MRAIIQVNLRGIIHAAGISLLAMTPTALIFGFLTWSHTGLWYFMLVLHCLGSIGLGVLLVLPEEQQWRFIKAFASLTVEASNNPDPKSYELLNEVEELERQDKEKTDMETQRNAEVWGATRRRERRTRGHGDV